MPDIPKQNEDQKKRDDKKEKSDDNSIETCAGGLTEQQVKELQEELERAKEENSFSTRSRCSIA